MERRKIMVHESAHHDVHDRSSSLFSQFSVEGMCAFSSWTLFVWRNASQINDKNLNLSEFI